MKNDGDITTRSMSSGDCESQRTTRLRVLATTVMAALILLFWQRFPTAARPEGNLLRNGGFEEEFLSHNVGLVGRYWIPYVRFQTDRPPQFLSSTDYWIDGRTSQRIWADGISFYAGVFQHTEALAAVGARYTALGYALTLYGGSEAPEQSDKMEKRIGIDPWGGTDPQSGNVVWSGWNSADKAWVPLQVTTEAQSPRLTVFIEVRDNDSGGPDQAYFDYVALDLEGSVTVGTPTPAPEVSPTPVVTPTPTATPTPPISVIRTIGVGQQPHQVDVDVRRHRYYVTNHADGTVSIIDGDDNWQVTTKGSLGQRPTGVAIDSTHGRVYVANSAENEVAVFDADAFTFITAIPLGPGRQPDGLAVLTNPHRIFVADHGSDSVSVINGGTLAVTTEIQDIFQPHRVAADPATGKVYVTGGSITFNRGAVTVIDGSSATVLKRIDLSSTSTHPAPGPYGVSVNPETHRVYVASHDGVLIVIDGETDTVLQRLTVPEASVFSAIAVNPHTNNVFVTAPPNQVFVFDGDTDSLVGVTTVGRGSWLGVTANPETDEVAVTNRDDNTVSILQDRGFFQRYRVYLPEVDQ